MTSTEANPIPRSEPTSGPFVLLVDDHGPTLQQLRCVVEREGHPCVSAGSASDALVYCDARPPQVVVTDLSMPDLDGEGLARWLKARFPRLPIILLTGQDLDADMRVHLKRTFADVLSKPVNVEPFLTLLGRLMDEPSSNHDDDPRRP